MEIKTSLKKLLRLFAQAVNDEALPEVERSLAAKNMVLTAHVQRVEAKTDAHATRVDAQIAELAAHIAILKQGTAGTPFAGPPPTDGVPEDAPVDEETAAKEMAARVLRETEAEERALAAATPGGAGATVTPLRQPNGEATPTDEAS